jgi:hypothetical protein
MKFFAKKEVGIGREEEEEDVEGCRLKRKEEGGRSLLTLTCKVPDSGLTRQSRAIIVL